jgi:hypothetical protein
MTEIYGQLQSEKLVEESKVSHEIVREINHFQINDRQRWLVIYYLSLELENIDEMKELTSFIKELKGDSLFVSKLYGAEEEGII